MWSYSLIWQLAWICNSSKSKLSTFSVKVQIVNIQVWQLMWRLSQPLGPANANREIARQCGHERLWLRAKKALFMDTEIWISYWLHVSWNKTVWRSILFLTSVHKCENFLACRLYTNSCGLGSALGLSFPASGFIINISSWSVWNSSTSWCETHLWGSELH